MAGAPFCCEMGSPLKGVYTGSFADSWAEGHLGFFLYSCGVFLLRYWLYGLLFFRKFSSFCLFLINLSSDFRQSDKRV